MKIFIWEKLLVFSELLVVTEGERAEPALIEELVKLGCYGQHAEIVLYGTNIHTLIAALKAGSTNSAVFAEGRLTTVS